MEHSKTGKEASLFTKTWKRCRSFRGLVKTGKATPEGFFPVYLGPDKQRFAVKTKCVSDPLFTLLLEGAVTEYGYNCEGPILLPCDVELFYKVLAEMQAKGVHALEII